MLVSEKSEKGTIEDFIGEIHEIRQSFINECEKLGLNDDEAFIYINEKGREIVDSLGMQTVSISTLKERLKNERNG